MKARLIESIEPGNPFVSDLSRMGVRVDERIMVMYDHHDRNDYIVIVNTETGERMEVTL